MYGSKPGISRNANAVIVRSLQRVSKTYINESPCVVTGNGLQAGLKEAPKGICTDRIIGTWKAEYMECLNTMKCR